MIIKKDNLGKIFKWYPKNSIRNLLTISFTIVTIGSMMFLGMSLYARFTFSTENIIAENNRQLLEEVNLNLDTYLRNMMRISDAAYYSVLKKVDIEKESIDDELTLLYETHKDSLISIAIVKENGDLVDAVPINNIKKNFDVTKEEWFTKANGKIENQHFSTPHVQDLFEPFDNAYHWVVSLSRMVDITEEGKIKRGVLLVDMKYSDIEQLLKKINMGQTGYVYLVNKNGEIIYHPKQQLIYSNLFEENNLIDTAYEDGTHKEVYNGEKRLVTIKTVGYTGWKIISVAENSDYSDNFHHMRFFFALTIILSIIFVIFVNRFLSWMISEPILKLERSVKGLENGDLNAEIYIGGSEEIAHLGRTLSVVVQRIRVLMEEVVFEQEKKRKSEFDALQSQINPHFLYNTLDSIVWMVECGNNEDAINMVTSLASLFRISLSKGKNIITVKDELGHAKHYMDIQKMRYQNKFTFEVFEEESALSFATIKLVIQPLLENAIYYGVQHMLDEGIITVRIIQKEDELCIDVKDNGIGIPKEQCELIMTGNEKARKKGSGIGLKNVHERIQLFFGERYGLEIESEPDEGTTIHIHLPLISYNDIKEQDL